MSQVAKAIIATDMGERKFIPKGLSPLFTDVFSSKSEIQETYSTEGEVAIKYRIGVKIGADCLVTDYDSLKDGNALQQAILRTKRQVIEGVFGEFRQHFRQIEKAIYDHNMEEAGKLLYQMEYKMFEEIE